MPLGLLRAIIIPMGGTNFIKQFMRIIIIIFIDILNIMQPFLDDFNIQRFKNYYDDQYNLPKMQRFI